jgi:hypothetical protein
MCINIKVKIAPEKEKIPFLHADNPKERALF